MSDTDNIRALFRNGHVSGQLRRLALGLEAVANRLGEPIGGAGLDLQLEECVWMIDSIDRIDDLDVVDELAELRRSLEEWRAMLDGDTLSEPARVASRDVAGAWSDRLMWISALLEATE